MSDDDDDDDEDENDDTLKTIWRNIDREAKVSFLEGESFYSDGRTAVTVKTIRAYFSS